MATARCPSKSVATFLQISAFRRGFCHATFGPPASTTIDEKKIKEEMRLLFPEHLKQKRSDLKKPLCVIQSFRHELQNGQWLVGSNSYCVEKEEDMYDDDKKMHIGGIRFLVDNEKGKLEVGRFYGEFED